MSIHDNLTNPDIKYRPIPFWSWNDKLDPQELRNQVNHMKNAGIGGYFMHARGGLLTDYMGDDWFDCVKACVDEGKRIGMNSWAYDENGWPSGFGDGMVNGMGLKYQQKYLRFKPIKRCEIRNLENTIAFFNEDGTQLISDPNKCSGEELLHCYFDVNPYYVDTLDAEVINEFLNKIYQAYYDKLTEDEWQNLAGFFTDEPQVSRNGIPWSFILEEEYQKAYGESLLPLLPQLTQELPGHKRTRYRFWKLITHLFMNNFMKQIHDWCNEHDCMVTGHHVLEETYNSQITSNGAVMPHYQYYHIPGMDWLGRHIKPVTTPVQVASVCAQLGKKQILSETFALCGWNVKFTELKWIYQWQMVHGINLLCQHLESYSLKGIRKRDYPASLFIHQPWWEDYRTFNDYVSRLGVLLAEGEIKTDVLVLHGQSSAWLCFNNGQAPLINSYFQSFNQLSELLNAAHVNYHYGDETMIAMHGSVSDTSFIIGQQSYKTIVIPQITNLSKEVYENLITFTNNGGTVLAVKNQHDDSKILVDGEDCDSIDSLTKKFSWYESEQELLDDLHNHTALCPIVPPDTQNSEVVKFASQLQHIIYTKRYFDDFNGSKAEAYYFINDDLNQGYEANIYLTGSSVEQFNPQTGKTTPLFYNKKNNQICVPHYFSPAGDLVLIVHDSEVSSSIYSIDFSRSNPADLASEQPAINLDGNYAITEMSSNILTLDYCTYSFDGELQETNDYVLNIQDRMLKLKKPVDLTMAFTFTIGDNYDLTEELFLVMEIPEKFEIIINNQQIESKDVGFMFDSAFRKIPVTHAVRKGVNTIQLTTLFSQPDNVYECIEAAKVFEAEKNKLSYSMEIEAIYLCGNFGVKPAGEMQPLEREAVRCSNVFELTNAPQNANISRLHEASLPFFAGKIKLQKNFTVQDGQELNRFLVFDKQKSIISKISINGQQLPTFLWHPFTADLNGLLKPGENVIEIELTNSLRNMLGPHHLEEGESHHVGPFSFYKESGVFSRTWNNQQKPWDDNYCIVEFGLDNLRIV